MSAEKELKFIGSSYDELMSMTEDVIHDAGYQLHLVQNGKEPHDWKPMSLVGDGAKEIRLWGDDGTYRVIYVAKFNSKVYVLHCFMKKNDHATPKRNIRKAAERYKEAQFKARQAERDL